jgi:DNA-binding response OmpR family regulator
MQDCNYLNKFKFNARNYNVLIVEDSTSMIKIINNIFTIEGFKPFLASTIKDAKEIMIQIK